LIGRREELKKVCEALKKDKNAREPNHKVAVIRAEPGEGKTRLAAEAVTHFPAHHSSAIDLSGTTSRDVRSSHEKVIQISHLRLHGSAGEPWLCPNKEEGQRRLGLDLLNKIFPLDRPSVSEGETFQPAADMFSRENEGEP
jgi:hypothetical protein